MRLGLAFVLWSAFVCQIGAQQPQTAGMPEARNPADSAKIAEVLAFEKEMEAAVLRGDVKFLERALADDYLFTHGDLWTAGGPPLRLDTKQTWIAYVSQKPSPYISRELDSVQVELHGDIAITCGRYRFQTRPTDYNPDPGRFYLWFVRLYEKRDGKWQHLSHRTVRGPIREEDSVSMEPVR